MVVGLRQCNEALSGSVVGEFWGSGGGVSTWSLGPKDRGGPEAEKSEKCEMRIQFQNGGGG